MCVALLWSSQMWTTSEDAGFQPVSQQGGYTLANRMKVRCAYNADMILFRLVKRLSLIIYICIYKPTEFFVLTQRHEFII